jgi:hypothetical protein
MKTIYLVKSSETLEDGSVHWENLKTFASRETAEAYAMKTAQFIAECDDLDDTDEVEIEEFTLED